MARTLLLFLHIASVAGWLGANYVQLVLAPRFAREGREAALAWSRQSNFLGQRYYNAIGALIAVTGVLLVIETGWDWSDGFVWVGIAAVVMGGVVGVAVFGPLGARRVEALERGDDQAASALLNRILTVAVVDTVVVLLAVLAMVDKWMAS